MAKPIAILLGSLEADIMGVVWREKGAVTVRDVVSALAKKRRSAYTTVMTVMNRLVAKGILKRQLDGGHYQYQAVHDQQRFAAQRTRRLAKQLVNQYGAVALAQFVDILDDVDPKLIEQLRKKSQS